MRTRDPLLAHAACARPAPPRFGRKAFQSYYLATWRDDRTWLARAALGYEPFQGVDDRLGRGVLQHDLFHSHLFERGHVFGWHNAASNDDHVFGTFAFQLIEYLRED